MGKTGQPTTDDRGPFTVYGTRVTAEWAARERGEEYSAPTFPTFAAALREATEDDDGAAGTPIQIVDRSCVLVWQDEE